MKIYAVLDTNVIVSSMLTRNQFSPTRLIMTMVRDGGVIPMINDDILEEYSEVLSRSKFNIRHDDIEEILTVFLARGLKYTPNCLKRDFVDANDIIFYETYLMRDDAYLITGNMRHFPSEQRILPPADMLQVIALSEECEGKVLSESVSLYDSEDVQSSILHAWEAFERIHATAVANGISDMTMEEIDEEIRQYREERRERLRKESV